jgi:flagellar hook assembly protein FlgD
MSTVSNINANTPVTALPTAASGTSSQTLTQADFLKIMVAQFTQQDPLSSGDSSGGGSGTSDYVNQLMSMTNLTTLQTMSGQQATQLAQTLPGTTVEVSDNGNTVQGVVQSARVDSSTGGVYFTVGGTEYPSADLYSINQTAAETTAQALTGAATATTNTTTTP